MRCDTCGNTQTIRDGDDWYCPFCHSRTASTATPTVVKTEPITSTSEVLRSTVRLRVEDRVGTGFVISPKGLVITNQHIVEDQTEVLATFDGSSDTYHLRVLYSGSEETDLCLLKIESANRFDYIPMAEEPPNLGDEIITIGNPRGIGLSVSKGVISRIGDDGDLQLNIQLNPGNSGGPVVNQQGELVGVISFLVEEIQAMSFAIGLPQIKAFIEEAKEAKGGQQ